MKNEIKTQYLIIGNGKLANHLRHYLRLLNLNFTTWHRGQSVNDETSDLNEKVNQSTHILIAISDSALEKFIADKLQLALAASDKKIIHFSGALHLPPSISCHPLMSFGPELYSLDKYQQIHFVLTGAESLKEALPGLTNSFSILPAEKKAIYHALCVLGGNLPVILWTKMQAGLKELGIPVTAERVYLEQVLENYLNLGEKALTGPIARHDWITIEKNLTALNASDRKIYSAFVDKSVENTI